MAETVALTANEVNDMQDTLALVPVMGECCVIASLFAKWPDCIGVQGKGEFICLQGTCIICKPAETEHEWCTFLNNRCICKSPEVCMQSRAQCFCFDIRSSLPCSKDVPCVLTVCGLNLCFQYACSLGCCQSIEAMTEKTGKTLPGQEQAIQARNEAQNKAESGVAKV